MVAGERSSTARRRATRSSTRRSSSGSARPGRRRRTRCMLATTTVGPRSRSGRPPRTGRLHLPPSCDRLRSATSPSSDIGETRSVVVRAQSGGCSQASSWDDVRMAAEPPDETLRAACRLGAQGIRAEQFLESSAGQLKSDQSLAAAHAAYALREALMAIVSLGGRRSGSPDRRESGLVRTPTDQPCPVLECRAGDACKAVHARGGVRARRDCFAAEVGASGEFKVLGSGVAVQGTSAITLTWRRSEHALREAESQRPPVSLEKTRRS